MRVQLEGKRSIREINKYKMRAYRAQKDMTEKVVQSITNASPIHLKKKYLKRCIAKEIAPGIRT